MKRLQELLKPTDYQVIVENYQDYNLDWDRVFDFAYNLNVDTIQNKSAYRRGAIIREIEKGTFIKTLSNVVKKGKVRTDELWKALEEKNVKLLGKSQLFIDNLEQYMYERDVPIEELIELNHQIVEFLKDGDDTEYYYDLLKHSNLIKKYNINVDEIESQSEQDWQVWEELLKEI